MELSQLLVRTLWIFQLFASFPVFLFLGVSTYINIFRTYEDAYDFTMHFCTCLLAGSIVFIILVQRRIHQDRLSTVLALRFEAAKAACATILWLWYFLDAAIGPRRYYNCIYDREKRVRAAGVFVILLPYVPLPLLSHGVAYVSFLGSCSILRCFGHTRPRG